MTINPPIKIRSFDSWKTINLRLSVFIASAIDLSEYISWSAVFEGLPDVQNSQPKIGLTEAAGELGDGQLFLEHHLDALTLFISSNFLTLLTRSSLSPKFRLMFWKALQEKLTYYCKSFEKYRIYR